MMDLKKSEAVTISRLDYDAFVELAALAYDESSLTDNTDRSRRIWKLVEYLILYHQIRPAAWRGEYPTHPAPADESEAT